jgi:hypothetical protein
MGEAMGGETRRVIAHRNASLDIVGWTLPGEGYSPPNTAVSDDALMAFIAFDAHSQIPALVAASQDWLSAVATIDQAVRTADPELTFQSAFGNVTAADLGLEIVRTDYEIVEEKNFGNGGVGAARRGLNGARNHDQLGREGVAGYGKAALANRGVVAQALHELGHLTEVGFKFYDRSLRKHREYARRRNYGLGFYSGPFAHNLECYANDMMLSFAAGLSLNLGNVIPGGQRLGEGPQNARDPDELYDELMSG